MEEARAHTQARYRKRRRGVWRRIEKGNAERDQGRPAGVGGQARGLTLSLIAAFVCGLACICGWNDRFVFDQEEEKRHCIESEKNSIGE